MACEKSFVAAVRGAEAQDGASHTQRSDADLATAGDSSCKLMKSGKFTDAYSALKSAGYPPPDIADIQSTAVQTLCPGQRAGYFAWLGVPSKGQ
jgi:hypothetical protein